MKNTFRRLFAMSCALTAALVLSGCAGFAKLPPGSDFGTLPRDSEWSVKNHFERSLKDPESARYRFGKFRRAYANKGLIYGGGVAWHGYLQEVEVNGKNSYGGYVGFKPFLVLFDKNSNTVFQSVPGTSSVLITIVD